MHGIPDIMIKIGPGQIDLTIEIMSLFVIIFLFIVAFYLSPKFTKLPGGNVQNICEMVVEFLNKLAVDMVGPKGRQYVPFVGTIFVFVLISNWMGLIPGNLLSFLTKVFPEGEKEVQVAGVLFQADWKGLAIQPPTGNLNTPLALALCAVIYYNYCGIRATGLKKYLLHHIGPIPELIKSFSFPLNLLIPPLTLLFLLINIMEHISRTFSLTVRLFCNIMGEHSVLAALIAVMLEIVRVKGLALMALPILIPIPLIVMGLGMITGAIQALIFSLLTFSYIASMTAEHH